jgi:hypothetical protein
MPNSPYRSSIRTTGIAVLGSVSLIGSIDCTSELGPYPMPPSHDVQPIATYAQVPFRGVNLASAEFAVDTEGNGSLPGVHGTNYVYPDSNYVAGRVLARGRMEHTPRQRAYRCRCAESLWHRGHN